MSRRSILTVDLNKDVTTGQRNKFNAKLQELGWQKVGDLTTLWVVTWKGSPTDADILKATKKDVETAAQAGEIESYDASAAVCGKPVVWTK